MLLRLTSIAIAAGFLIPDTVCKNDILTTFQALEVSVQKFVKARSKKVVCRRSRSLMSLFANVVVVYRGDITLPQTFLQFLDTFDQDAPLNCAVNRNYGEHFWWTKIHIL